MKFVCISHGSTGDILPPAILLGELARRGHQTRLLAAPLFEPLAREQGTGFTPIAPFGEADRVPEAMESISGIRSPRRLLNAMYRLLAPETGSILATLREELDGADALIVNSIFPFWSRVGTERGVPTVSLHFCHDALPSSHRLPHGTLALPRSLKRLRRAWARLLWWLGERVVDQQTTRALRGGGAPDAILPVRKFFRRPADFALVPLPAALFLDPGIRLDCPYAFTGYLRRPATPVPTDLENQLHEFTGGEPVPLISFGSMRTPQLRAQLQQIADALPADQRCILVEGWTKPHPPERNGRLLVLPPTPHEWVLPHASVMLHHGGSGTTAAALTAGVPHLIHPFFADQPFWAAEITRLGCGRRLRSLNRPQFVWEQLIELGRDRFTKDACQRAARALGTNRGAARAAEQLLAWLLRDSLRARSSALQ